MPRVIETNLTEEDKKIEKTLRPQCLDDYIGQEKAKSTLKIYIEAAKQRHDSLDHVLFYGPPGLGKTTLAGIIANEMGVNMKVTSGPAIEKPGEMAAILNNLQEGDLLFVDEIHRLNRQVEEVLYPAMEDFAIDIMIGKGSTARSVRLDLPHFTLVGATTRAGLLTAPLRDRFGMIHHMEFYTEDELKFAKAISEGVGDSRFESLEKVAKNCKDKKVKAEVLSHKGEDIYRFVAPFNPDGIMSFGSTDVGDVSWNCPTAQAYVTTWAAGTPGHSWQVVSQGKSGLAHKGLIYAAKAMAGAAVDMYEDPEIIAKAKAEMEEDLDGETYHCPIPDGCKPRALGMKM